MSSQFLKSYRPLDILNIGEKCGVNKTACIWLNGSSPNTSERSYWSKLWNNASYRLATDGAVNHIMKRTNELKLPDFVCGDFDSIEDIESKRKMFNLIHLPDQMKTDLQKTIEFCFENIQNSDRKWSFDEIVLLGGLSGRFDHTMSTLSTLTRFAKLNVCLKNENRKEIYVFDGDNLVLAIPQGRSEITVDMTKCTKKCGVIPLVQKETIVTSKGLEWNLENQKLEFGELISTSNELVEETICLESNNPILFTIELRT